MSTWKMDRHTDLFSAKHTMVTTVRGTFGVVEGLAMMVNRPTRTAR
jgi:hypothetical protein